jgi:hypothetical protein
MHKPIINAMLLAAVLLACGAADKEQAADKQKDSSKPKVAEKAKGKDDKGKDDKEKPKEDEKPACMHCGATCGLEPICVCEPGTKKQPKVEFDVKCEPICVAGCGSKPRPFDLPPLNGTTSRERIWEWSKPREATNATRKEGTG